MSDYTNLRGLTADIATRLKRLERNRATNTATTSTSSELSGGLMVLNFIDPVTVGTGTASTNGYVPYEIPRSVPNGAQALLLESEWALSSPDVGAEILDAKITIATSATPTGSYVLSRGRSAGEYDNIAGANQALMPYDISERKLYYSVPAPGFNNGWTIRLIGYLK